jgi:hypothetical protein
VVEHFIRFQHPLLHTSQGSAFIDLYYVSFTVCTSICENNYAQQNIRDRGSNSRPPDPDTILEDLIRQSDYKT